MSEITNSLRLEPSTVLFPHTYITSISRITIKIINDSNSNVHFEWRKYSSATEENAILLNTDVDDVENRQKFADILMYSSPTFKFLPEKGEIWAKRSQEFIINFTPDVAQTYDDQAYLYVIETGQRIELPLHGCGLQPDAKFNVDSINIGHVALESILEYQVKMTNVGLVEIDFTIEKKKDNEMTFEFNPDHGIIPIGQSIAINIKFIANAVGSFSEVFTFLIKGATKFLPTLTLYGRVIGPSFLIGTKSINFGTISFGFLYSQTFDIENKSQIPFDYTLRLLQDGSFSRREFTITPACGTIEAYTKQPIKLEFIPTLIKNYNVEIHFDISKFGKSLAIIPITASCICPVVRIENPEVDLGNLFINHPYTSSIQITDESQYPAKYEFIPSNDTSQLQAKTEVRKPNGSIEPLQTSDFRFTITPTQLGPIYITQYIKIYGSDDPPLPFVIKAVCTGPNIVLSTPLINFGSVQLLKDSTYILKVQNKSLIQANFTANITGPNGGFSVSPDNGQIPPNATLELNVTTNMDDNIQFAGKLNLIFEHLNPIVVELKANGIGSPVVPSIDMSEIKMGCIFTERPVIKRIIFDNRGRKPQEIRWVQQKPKVEGSGSPNFTFQVKPDQVMIDAHSQQEFNFIFQCNKPSTFVMNLTCNTTIKRKRVDLFTPEFSGTFVRPIVKLSTNQIEFKHFHDVKSEENLCIEEDNRNSSPNLSLLNPMKDNLQITNNSKLPLHIYVDCPNPFSCDFTEFDIEIGETKTLEITFDPSFKKDYISETTVKKLTFSYKGHPSTTTVTLRGIIVFPNLSFSPSEKLNFGILMTNTEQSRDVDVTNVSELPADFQWQLLPGKNGVEIAKIFDIYPTRSHLEPGEKAVTRFSFFSLSNSEGKSARYQGTAVCHVTGGPEYVMKLKGGSAFIQYKIDTRHFEFGMKPYKEVLTDTFTIQNLSDAPFSYSVKIPKGCNFQDVRFYPNDGQLAIGASVKINLSIICGLPMIYNEQFFVQIGHVDDVRIDATVHCFIPQVSIGLPRPEDDPLMTSYIEKFHPQEKPTEEELAVFDSQMYVQRATERLTLSQTAVLKSPKKRAKKKYGDSSHYFDGYISNTYLIDFGQIVFGKVEKKEFAIKNITPFPISFDIWSDSLNGTGFGIDQTSFENVPADEELKITVTFDNQRRTLDILGDVEFELPVVFNEDLGSILHIKASLTMPTLNFSNMHFNFGNVIVGQSRVLTLQLQNLNKVQVEFSFSEAQYTNVLYRSLAQGVAPAFTASPSSGLLPASSFLNVELTFSPKGDKNYSMQFPITIKHNTQQSFVTMRGNGIQLKIVFDPPELIMPPINPFSEPSEMDVQLINPTDYPIEVMAPQFDLQLVIDSFQQQNQQSTTKDAKQESKNELETVTIVPPNSQVSKFSICVIVSGPLKSGKSTVARIISEYLNNAPIIILKDVWKDLIENKPDATPDDYISTLSNYINVGDCAEGFIIDGLDAVLSEPPETDQFLSHCLKSKNNDTNKNPFLIIPHSVPTSSEQVLSYVLQALDGHYVFHVALNASEDVVVSREEKIKSDERKKKKIMEQKAKEDLFLMTEEQYLALNDEEREEVDKKRSSVRQNLLQAAIDADENNNENSGKSKRSKSSSSKHKSHHSKSKEGGGEKEGAESGEKKHRSKHRSKSATDEKPPNKEKSKDKEKQENDSNSKKKKVSGIPTDPIPKSIMTYKYTLGSITQKVQASGGTFQVIDPIDLQQDDKKEKKKVDEEEEEKNSSVSSQRQENAKSKKNKSVKKDDQLATQIAEDKDEMLVTKLAHPKTSEEEEEEEEENKQKEEEEEEIQEDNKISLPDFAIQNLNTLLINNGPTRDEIKTAISIFLPNLHQLEEKAFTRLIPPPRMILPSLSTRKKITAATMPLFFSIINEEVPEESDSSRMKFRPDSHQKTGRKSRSGKSKNNDPLQEFLDDLDMSKYTQRWSIEAKSSKTMTIQFNAQLIGLYKDTIMFALVNGKSDFFRLNVAGECAYPDVDRSLKTVFPKRVSKLDSNVEFSYVNDVKEFHFGSLIVAKDKGGKTGFYRQFITLQNVSPFPVEFTSFLVDKQPPWILEASSGTIEVGQSFQLYFGITPLVPNLYRNQLFVLIKDHPDPLSYAIVCDACSPVVEVNDTTLDFEKLLLTQTKTLKLELRNTGKLNAFWRLKNTNTLGDTFKFSMLEGTLKPNAVVNVSVTYASQKPLTTKKQILFEVLDDEKSRVFISKQIQIVAESFDVNFDFQYPKGMDHFQFGSMKVGQQKMLACTLVNKGKYVTNYKFTLSGQSMSKLFQIAPSEGSLNPGKPINVNLTITTNSLCKYRNSKGITLSIIDSLTETTTATIPIPFSVESFYSSFLISPSQSFDFGPTAVNSTVSKIFTISNNGVFPFEYEIVGKTDVIQPVLTQTLKGKKQPPQKGAKNGSGGSGQSGNDKKKGSDKTVFIGSFSLFPSIGTIQPGNESKIQIDFCCSLPGVSKSVAQIKISTCNPKKDGDVKVTMNAESFVPGLDIADHEQIFQGTHLCLRYDLPNIGNQNAFLEDELVFHFAPLILQQKSSVDINLINPLPIACSVDINVGPPQKSKSVKSSFPFDLSVKSVDIPANSSKPLTLTFLPVLCEKYSAVFEAVVRGGTDPDTKALKFIIEGVGTLPTVTALTQFDGRSSKGSNFSINMGRTLIGFTKEKTVALKNDGLIPAKLSITAKASPDFKLDGFDSIQETTLETGHILNLPIIFQPEKPRKDQFDISVSVVDNPKANLAFAFIGEGFTEDIIFEGLSEEENDLNFKDNIVGRQQIQSFRLMNVSTDDIRFSWVPNNDFTFQPKTGHLRKGTSKEITVIFSTEKPVKYNNLKVNCQWSKITLENPDAPDWDDTMKVVKFVSKSSLQQPLSQSPSMEDIKGKKNAKTAKNKVNVKAKNSPSSSLSKQAPPSESVTASSSSTADDEIVKVIEVKPEPPNESQFAKPKDLALKVNAISDYIRYQIDTSEISFLPTMMYQTRVSTLKVTNPSAIRFEYSWIVCHFLSLRTPYAATRKPPFSVMPSTGVIESGQSVIFKVKFSPEEVDDFSAELRMEIPFLTAMEPPVVTVSAFSRRPLCHFNVEMSDYLSAGRRHPDYTDPLPADIKVIEIFAPTVGAKRYKRFEIINPTASPYEVKWILRSNPENCPIDCDTPSAFISSGKRFSASFSYTPNSVKTVEVLWEFQIPEHDVSIPFLTVGRIMPTNK